MTTLTYSPLDLATCRCRSAASVYEMHFALDTCSHSIAHMYVSWSVFRYQTCGHLVWRQCRLPSMRERWRSNVPLRLVLREVLQALGI